MSEQLLKDLHFGDMFILKATGSRYTVGYLHDELNISCINLDTFEIELLPMYTEVELRMIHVGGSKVV